MPGHSSFVRGVGCGVRADLHEAGEHGEGRPAIHQEIECFLLRLEAVIPRNEVEWQLVLPHERSGIRIGFYADEVQDDNCVYGCTMNYDHPVKSDQLYRLEQHIMLNTPGENDGILRGWTDGKLVFEKIDCIWRNTDRLKVKSC